MEEEVVVGEAVEEGGGEGEGPGQRDGREEKYNR